MDDWLGDERELVQRCREGSEVAYAILVRRHRPRVYTLAYRLLGDRESAEDVVQETFIAAFQGMERFEPKPSLAPWLNTIALRLARRQAQRRWGRTPASLDELTGDGGPGLASQEPTVAGDPHAAAVAAELRGELAAAIRDLPFNYRAAVVLRHVLGLDYAEAAASLNLPLNTYKSHLLRGTRLLRERLSASLDGAAGAPSESDRLSAAGSVARDPRQPPAFESGASAGRRAAPLAAVRAPDLDGSAIDVPTLGFDPVGGNDGDPPIGAVAAPLRRRPAR